MQEDEKNVEDETQMLITSDFEIGHFLRVRIIPKATLYYNDEMIDEDDDGEEDEDERTGNTAAPRKMTAKIRPSASQTMRWIESTEKNASLLVPVPSKPFEI